MLSRILLACLALAVAAGAAAQQVKVSAKGPASAKLNKTFPVWVVIQVPAGYHIYGTKLSGDLGVATQLNVKAPAGVKVGAPVFPKPGEMTASGQRLPVYEGTVRVKVPVTVTSKAVKKADLKFTLRSQVCNDRICLPPTTVTASAATPVK